MKTLRRGTGIHLLLVMVMLSLTIAGCNIQKSQPESTATPTPTVSATATPGATQVSQPPAIPPMETFLIPFDAFTGNETSAVPSGTEPRIQFTSLVVPDGGELPVSPAAIGDKSNWNHATFNVGFWNVVVVVGLAVPVAAFAASFQNIPLQQPDGSWVWSYSVRIGSTVYSAELHGEYIAQGVRWEMRISKEGGYQDFLWYYGENNLPATEGFWIMKESPEKPNDLLRIDWSRSIADGTYAIRYTNIVPGGPENGGYIDVQYTKEIPYDYLWDIYNKGQDNHTYIEWSDSTKEGRVQDFKHFGDDDWHCWDSGHMNVACPSGT